jgi:hypothetical protein
MKILTRREWLQLMTGSSVALAWAMADLRSALAAESIKPGVARLRGPARVNGIVARAGTPVNPGDVIVTGPKSEMAAVIGHDAFLIRENSRVEFGGNVGDAVVQAMRVVTGAMLSVFGKGQHRDVRTVTATIGIRGTGLYVEVTPDRTYACTCYGEAELVPIDDPGSAEVVRTKHHDAPRYIYPKGMPRMIEVAPVINHTDAELVMLEGLVGRKVPFPPYAPYPS